MDEYSRGRIAGGLVISKKGPSLVLRDSTENNRAQNVQVSSRGGCSSQVNSVSPGKSKVSKTHFRPYRYGKEVIGSSSRSSSRKTVLDPKMKSPIETDSETTSLNDEFEEVSQSIPTSGKTKIRINLEPENHEGAETGCSSLVSTKRLVKSTRKFGSSEQNIPASASSSTSFAFKQGNQGERNRYSLKSLRCNSISDVVPSSSSYSSFKESGLSRSDIGRKRVGEPNSSLSAKGMINGTTLNDGRNERVNRGISISDSRQSRNSSSSRDSDSLSLRVRLTGRTRVSNQENPNRLSLESTVFNPEIQFSTRSLLNRISASTGAGSFNREDGIRDHTRPNRSLDSHDVGIGRSIVNQSALREYNLDTIAEMLSALGRIEQAEETTYELLMETNLFLGGLAFHDRHRDMRLDIDNMSYEELLALGERMGSVSTALPEEALIKCLKRSIYQGTADTKKNEDDFKCSICQEEYTDGDEVGRLGCEHRYHVKCIQQWLNLKNWCPICKASASTSLSPP